VCPKREDGRRAESEKKGARNRVGEELLGCPQRRDGESGARERGRREGREDEQRDGEDDGMAWASLLEWETVPCWETTTKLGEKRTGDLYK